MNKLVVVLGFTTVAFAGFAAYLGRELSVERERTAALERAAAIAQAAKPTTRASPPQSAVTSSPAAPPATAAASTAAAPPGKTRLPGKSPHEDKVVREALLRDQLAQYTDPARRAEVAARFEADLRSRMAGMAAKVGMTAEEEARLLSLMVDDQMKTMEADARCNLDRSRCDPNLFREEAEAMMQAELALLGRDRYERFVTFYEGYADRVQVRELRARLSDGETLSDADADRLASLLSEERRKFVDEAKQRGDSVGGFGTQLGYLVTYAPRGASARAAQNLQSAEEFSRRQHERAAEVLSSRQMGAYERMQEELLTWLRDQARREEIAQAALADGKQR